MSVENQTAKMSFEVKSVAKGDDAQTELCLLGRECWIRPRQGSLVETAQD